MHLTIQFYYCGHVVSLSRGMVVSEHTGKLNVRGIPQRRSNYHVREQCR